jgi:hypothetical protein
MATQDLLDPQNVMIETLNRVISGDRSLIKEIKMNAQTNHPIQEQMRLCGEKRKLSVEDVQETEPVNGDFDATGCEGVSGWAKETQLLFNCAERISFVPEAMRGKLTNLILLGADRIHAEQKARAYMDQSEIKGDATEGPVEPVIEHEPVQPVEPVSEPVPSVEPVVESEPVQPVQQFVYSILEFNQDPGLPRFYPRINESMSQSNWNVLSTAHINQIDRFAEFKKGCSWYSALYVKTDPRFPDNPFVELPMLILSHYWPNETIYAKQDIIDGYVNLCYKNGKRPVDLNLIRQLVLRLVGGQMKTRISGNIFVRTLQRIQMTMDAFYHVVYSLEPGPYSKNDIEQAVRNKLGVNRYNDPLRMDYQGVYNYWCRKYNKEHYEEPLFITIDLPAGALELAGQNEIVPEAQ